jgi:spore coat protein A
VKEVRLTSRGLSRRGFLRASGGLAGALVLADVAAGGSPVARLLGSASARANEPFTVPLRFPPVLTGDRITLVAQAGPVQVLEGKPTTMWTFNGEFPGPTIRRPSGRRTQVTVRHALPAEAGTLTIHHHGGHQPSSEDGQPERYVIEPGAARTYTYDLMEDGAPERGALQWYHDHSHFRTSRNVWRGLAGMVILDDPAECDLGLPCDAFDLPLMIGDRSFDEDNQLVDPFPEYDEDSGPGAGAGFPPFDDVFGQRHLVNGVPEPFVVVEPRRYRLRILNSAVFRIYNLALSDDSDLVMIGTESGLMPVPLRAKSLLLGPGERVDLVVDFSGKSGEEIELRSVGRTDSSSIPRTAPAEAPLLQFRVSSKKVRDTSRVPAALRPLPEWVGELSSQPDRIWAFGVGTDTEGRSAWTINGLAFDHERVDARPELGSTETWLLTNTSAQGTSHYIHIHDVDWIVLSRNGGPPLPEESGLKETFRIDPGEVVLVGTKFTDHLGPYMLHCHMLQHEDHGMMTTFEVVPPGEGDLPALPASREAALQRDVPDPVVRSHVDSVCDAARGGKPAPVWVLERCEPGAAPVAPLEHVEHPDVPLG